MRQLITIVNLILIITYEMSLYKAWNSHVLCKFSMDHGSIRQSHDYNRLEFLQEMLYNFPFFTRFCGDKLGSSWQKNREMKYETEVELS